MTTILCFLTIKYQLSNTLSHVCFEKIPRSWEFTHNWHSLVLARSHPGANADDALKETLQPEEVCSNKFWKLRHYSYLFLLKSTFLRAPPCYCSSALLVSIFSLTYVHCSSSWRFSFELYRNQMRCRINFNNKLFLKMLSIIVLRHRGDSLLNQHIFFLQNEVRRMTINVGAFIYF